MARLYKFALTLVVCAAFGLFTSAKADTIQIITPSNPQGWAPANVQPGGSAAITNTNPRSGDGSVEMSTNGSGAKADFQLVQNFGTLSSLTNLSIDTFRDGLSTADPNLNAAFRLVFQNASGQFGQLIWERVYNLPGATPLDQWVTNNMTQDHFWLKYFGQPAVEEFDHNLTFWQGDSRVGNASIVGINFGVGSGWAGTFHGFADNVSINGTTYNFEVNNATATPEPMTALLLGTGLAGVAAKLRRRRKGGEEV
jgi:hypothetical protein